MSDPRDRASVDPRDAFMKDLDLPRDPERDRVLARGGDVRLRGSESRTLSIVGAFRVVPAGDLRDAQERPLDPRTSDLRHLKKWGLVQVTPAAGNDRALVVLTEKGETFSNVTIGRRSVRGRNETCCVESRTRRPRVAARPREVRCRPGAPEIPLGPS